METLNATRIGSGADALLRESKRRWAVLASVSEAIYVESDSGDILWIAVNSSAMHHRAVLVPHLPAALPAAGCGCFIEDGSLRIGEETTVWIAGASVWSQVPLSQEGMPAAGLADRTDDTIKRIARRSPVAGSLARAALSIVEGDLRGLRGVLGAAATATAKAAVASFSTISSGRALPKALDEADGLVGLGEGLTPSGDDLLGGFLFTLRTLDSGLSGRLGIGWHHVEAWLQRIEERTNRISFSVLADHARGEASAVLSEFVHAVLKDSPQEDLVKLGIAVARVGHSSGWDMLAGVRWACLCATRILEDAFSGPCVAADRGQAVPESEGGCACLLT